MGRREKPPAARPAWFRPEFYGFLEGADLWTWSAILEEQMALRLWAARTQNVAAQWLAFRPNGSASYDVEGERPEAVEEACDEINADHPLDPVKELTFPEADRDPFIFSQKSALLRVDLGVPPAVLRESFDAWLAERVAGEGAPVRRGRQDAKNQKFTEVHFRSWAHNRLIEVADLDFWKMISGDRFTDEDVGGWLFSGYQEPWKKVVAARKQHRELCQQKAVLAAQEIAASKRSGRSQA